MFGGTLPGNPASTLPTGGTTGGGNTSQPSGPTIKKKSYPGINVYSISGNNYSYSGPQLNYDLNSASNLRQYNLQEYVYSYGSNNTNNKKSNGSNSSNNGGNGILSDIENLPTIDYILIAGAIIIVVMLI